LCLFTIQSGQWSVAEAERGVTGQGGVDDSPVSRAEQQTDAAGTRAGEDERETSRVGRPGSAGIATGLSLPPSPFFLLTSTNCAGGRHNMPPPPASCRCPLVIESHGKSWNLGRPFPRPGKSWKMMIMSWNFYYSTEQFCKSDTTSFIKSNYEPLYLFINGTVNRWNCHY